MRSSDAAHAESNAWRRDSGGTITLCVRLVAVCSAIDSFATHDCKGGTMEVNGIAHIFLTASNYKRSREFYRELLPFLGLKPVIDTETTYYCVGGRTAVGISAPSAPYEGAALLE
jgi:hypothetical protein